ncbi:TIGR01777 family oxidoreductase [Bacillus massiliigorillae]|uniref:TIGR01777 family oxidoreductase n=1 Tax=Bacillus massiliigorillae TaxID=1243664 RepID=UPI00039F6586|nr:TIGR01777 family oxidoreductase [Bacillus massiliigorillae]
MKVAIAGGSGFVGKAITKELLANNHDIYILTRDKSRMKHHQKITYIQWLNTGDNPESELNGVDVIINLAGESLNSGRWTASRKKSILESRLQATTEIKRIINSMTTKPHTLLNASAIGYYGTSDTNVFTEEDIISPTDFLSDTVHQWEQQAMQVETYGVRIVCMRFGVILGKEDGALPRMLLPYKLFVGGTVGSGKQWLSWIHIKDVVKAALFCINNTLIHGAVNFTSPHPETMKTFGQTIAFVMHRSHWVPAPAPILQLALGEMSILVLKGQKVLPTILEQHGYNFYFPTLQEALQDLSHSNWH